MQRSLLAAALATSLFAGAAVRAAEPPYDADAAKALFEARCSRCHPLDRATRKTKDRAGWLKTIERMKGYAGGVVTDDDAALILEYLARTRGPKP